MYPKSDSLRAKYTNEIYQNAVARMKVKLREDRILLAVDATQDAAGRNVGACVVQSLDNPQNGAFLANLKSFQEDSVTAEVYTTFFKESVSEIYAARK